MHFEYWGEGIKFIIIFFFLMTIPCVGTALIGYRMLSKLGSFPSKTPFIQMSIFLKLIAIEVVSFILLIAFYNIFATD